MRKPFDFHGLRIGDSFLMRWTSLTGQPMRPYLVLGKRLDEFATRLSILRLEHADRGPTEVDATTLLQAELKGDIEIVELYRVSTNVTSSQ